MTKTKTKTTEAQPILAEPQEDELNKEYRKCRGLQVCSEWGFCNEGTAFVCDLWGHCKMKEGSMRCRSYLCARCIIFYEYQEDKFLKGVLKSVEKLHAQGHKGKLAS